MIREQMREILPRYTKGCNDCPVDKCDHCGAFDGIYKELHSLLCAEIEKMGVKLTALPDKVYENEPHPLETKAGYLAGWNDGTEAQLQKILNKLKEGAE